MADLLIVILIVLLFWIVFGTIRYIETLRRAIIELNSRTTKLEKRWIIKVVDK